MKKNLKEMIEELNEYCKRSLTITCYNARWEIGSYAEDSIFNWPKRIEANTILIATTRAYNLMKKDKEKQDG